MKFLFTKDTKNKFKSNNSYTHRTEMFKSKQSQESAQVEQVFITDLRELQFFHLKSRLAVQ